MREYVVLEIKCKKEIDLLNVYSIIKSRVSYNSNLFAIQNLNLNNINEQLYGLYNKLNLCKFEYKIVLEHLFNTAYYNPKQHDRKMISNLDENWNWYNKKKNDSLCENDFKDLLTFCNSLKALDVSSFILGFDQIEWDGNKVSAGTYGFEKADCTYSLGRNYLSNSIIIGRTYQNKSYTAFISCEKHFRKLDVIDNIVKLLGTMVSETVCFAPENKNERDEWIQKYNMAKKKFENAVLGLQGLNFDEYKKKCIIDYNNKKINIKKYIKKFLCTNGWGTRAARVNEHPTVIYKEKNDKEIVLSIVSGHNGQHLQVIISYGSKEFLFSENLHNLSIYTSDERDIEIFFYNVIKVREYFFDLL